MESRGHGRSWQCVECGAGGIVPPAQPLWLIECDDCREGELVWANDYCDDGFSWGNGGDSPLDAPSVITHSDLRLSAGH